MYRYLIIVLLPAILILSCYCEKKAGKDSIGMQVVHQVAKNKFHNKYKITFNNTKDYALVTHREKTQIKVIPDLSFFIYSLDKREIIFADTLRSGNVYWKDKSTIRAVEYDNKAEASVINTYDYNVYTKKKLK